LNAVDALRPVAAGAGLTLSQLALAWVLHQRGVSAVIVGATRPEQVRENVAASDVKLSDDTLRAVDDALRTAVVS
jgi:aryl-alcohol dehydrogenase-like predicted oxidoreductase